MNKTQNYQLNQWEKTDKVLMKDFNADNQKIDAAIRNVAPAGLIALWSGAAEAIPAGWALCDGQNGTPDLRDRFVVGAGDGEYAVGDTGGIATETLEEMSRTSGTIFETFYAPKTELRENRPPYYALCYIMRL